MDGWKTHIIAIFFSCLAMSCACAQTTPAATPVVEIPIININGAIGPAVSDYLTTEITRANDEGSSPLIIITLDTPGGLVSSLRDINQRILSSNIPIACLVYPQGARAASAGTYILYACHIAAMAKATTLGAATPVSIGSPMPTPAPESDKDKPQDSKPSAMEKKVLNDAIAYIRSLAQLRGRNQEWAERAVREAATLTADEALAENVINLMAESPQELVERLDGWVLTLKEIEIQLQLKNVKLVKREADWRNRFIATITDPNIAYILMLIGIYGLLLEFYSPGVGVAGVTGAIALVIALYAFQMLPLNYAGLALLILGVVLLVAESMVPSFGIFGLGGIIAFVVGSIFLIDTEQAHFQVSIPLIAGVTFFSLGFFVFVLGYLWRARKNQIVSGQEAILGAVAIVLYDFDKQGYVQLNGERWLAHTTQPLTKNQPVVVEKIDGLTLTVSAGMPKEPFNGTHSE